jgi:DNA processing protein
MDYRAVSLDELLGPLNEVERRNAPKSLFIAGDTRILEVGARVSIAGARDAGPEGIRRAAKLAGLLSGNGIVVVSGLEGGIETAAHEAAVRHGGRSIVVLDPSLDLFDPRQNEGLQPEIAEDHLVVSPYPTGRPIPKKDLSLRDRTMALISDATVIIEAGDSSGCLDQGWEALRLGRPLLIADSMVEETALKWLEQMLHYGARLLSDDSLEEFLELLPARMATHLDGGIPSTAVDHGLADGPDSPAAPARGVLQNPRGRVG